MDLLHPGTPRGGATVGPINDHWEERQICGGLWHGQPGSDTLLMDDILLAMKPGVINTTRVTMLTTTLTAT
jgi:hypothetical protein